MELSGMLRERGWEFAETSDPAPKINGIAVFSRGPVRRREAPVPPEHSFRWVERGGRRNRHRGFADSGGSGGVRGPAAMSKRRLWDALLDAARDRMTRPFLFCGAGNSGLHYVDGKGKTYVCAGHFAALSEMGWTDLWRRFHPGVTEWTWYSNGGNGFRVDHAFASPALVDRVRSCRYSHVEREAKISDHSIVLAEVDERAG